jgi:hypothetical protein
MTLGQILFELRATQRRTEGQTDGRTDRGKSKCPPLKWGHNKKLIVYRVWCKNWPVYRLVIFYASTLKLMLTIFFSIFSNFSLMLKTQQTKLIEHYNIKLAK